MVGKNNIHSQIIKPWKKSKKRFIPGLVLNEGFYHDLIKPILDEHFPNLKYAACRIGPRSDVLGFDTYISMDHDWGPLAQIFLSEEDHFNHAEEIKRVLKENLPTSYKGFPTNWTAPGSDNTRHPEFSPEDPFNPILNIMTVRQFIKESLDFDYSQPVTLRDWFAFSEQELLHIVVGKIFHNDLPELDEMRKYFNYYPEPVWLLRMYALWSAISEEQAFIGRCHDIGDELGERLITARIVNKLMKLCFYLERKYYPYSKWFGTGFSKLNCGQDLQPIFQKALSAKSYKQRNQALCSAYLKVAEMHNALNISTPVPIEIVNYYERGYKGLQTNNLMSALAEIITPEILKELSLTKLDSNEARIFNIEPLLDDSNYTRTPTILRKMLLELKLSV